MPGVGIPETNQKDEPSTEYQILSKILMEQTQTKIVTFKGTLRKFVKYVSGSH
jgi:hypothetical protein